MILKHIDRDEAARLLYSGRDTLVVKPGSRLEDAQATTLSKLLEGCLFFRDEPAADNPDSVLAVCSDPDSQPAATDKPSVDSCAKRARADTGKLMALHKAGWSQKKIADELKVAPSTVCTYLKKMEEEDHEKD